MKKFTLAHLIKTPELVLPSFTLEDPLTFIAEEDDSKIVFGSDNDGFLIRYNKNDEWQDYILGSEIILKNGQYVQFTGLSWFNNRFTKIER